MLRLSNINKKHSLKECFLFTKKILPFIYFKRKTGQKLKNIYTLYIYFKKQVL